MIRLKMGQARTVCHKSTTSTEIAFGHWAGEHGCSNRMSTTTADSQPQSLLPRRKSCGLVSRGTLVTVSLTWVENPSRGRALCALDWFGCLGEVKWVKSDQKVTIGRLVWMH